MAAYFVPGFRLRRALARVARGGGRVQLLLAGKSDVALAQAAGRLFAIENQSHVDLTGTNNYSHLCCQAPADAGLPRVARARIVRPD